MGTFENIELRFKILFGANFARNVVVARPHRLRTVTKVPVISSTYDVATVAAPPASQARIFLK